MISVFHSVLCSDAITDSRSGQISYVKVIDTVNAQQFPIALKGVVLGMLCRSVTLEPSAVRIDLVAPDNTTMNIMMFKADITSAPHKILINIEQLPFTMEGLHTLLVSCKDTNVWKAVASTPINVISNS